MAYPPDKANKAIRICSRNVEIDYHLHILYIRNKLKSFISLQFLSILSSVLLYKIFIRIFLIQIFCFTVQYELQMYILKLIGIQLEYLDDTIVLENRFL